MVEVVEDIVRASFKTSNLSEETVKEGNKKG